MYYYFSTKHNIFSQDILQSGKGKVPLLILSFYCNESLQVVPPRLQPHCSFGPAEVLFASFRQEGRVTTRCQCYKLSSSLSLMYRPWFFFMHAIVLVTENLCRKGRDCIIGPVCWRGGYMQSNSLFLTSSILANSAISSPSPYVFCDQHSSLRDKEKQF
jgi:hypothetical protein